VRDGVHSKLPAHPSRVEAAASERAEAKPKLPSRWADSESTVLLKPNAHGLPHTEANQPSPIALSEAV
jgi:hypothetical protein